MMNTTSKNALAAVLAFAAALSTGACATEDVSTEMPDMVQVDATEIETAAGPRAVQLIIGSVAEDPIVIEAGVCTCDSPSCVEQYIRDNIGCDVCVDFTCLVGNWVGGCVRCEP